MSVLVTGGDGFVGRWVVPLLAEAGLGEVLVATRAASVDPVAIAGVRRVPLDLYDAAAIHAVMGDERPSHLLHLAWYAAPGRFWTAAENVDHVAATMMLYRAFAEAGGQRMVAAGSCAEYDWSGSGVMDERTTPLAPATPYGIAKDAARRVLTAFGDHGGPAIAWGRVFWLYGPGERPGRLVSDVAAALARGDIATCGPGLEQRDFMHVAEVAAAFAAALRATATGSFNIGSGKAVAVRDIALTLAHAAGRPDLVRFGQSGAAPAAPLVVAATSRLRDEIGFTPSIDLAEGLRDTLTWWRDAQGCRSTTPSGSTDA